MDNKENNSPLSGEGAPQVKTVEDVMLAIDKTGTIIKIVDLNNRIAELEAENAKMREALEGIKTLNGAVPMPAAKRIAEQALKGKEAKGE